MGSSQRPSGVTDVEDEGTAFAVLVVDDDPRRTEALHAALDRHGYDVLVASDPYTALGLARAHEPALVLVASTPRLEPAALCRRLRTDWRCGSPSILVLAPRPGDVLPLPADADDYVVVEPLDEPRLVARIAATVRRAREMRGCSPLTGLPGNVAIEQHLRERIVRDDGLALLYVDLDNFKAFNDRYGFLRGDEVLRGVAGVLREAVEDLDDAFVGHVGGDDFVVVVGARDADTAAERITAGVDAIVPRFYDPEDAEQGRIEVVDRQGERHSYPFVTASIGVATTDAPTDYRAVVDAATEMKQVAKRTTGSAVAFDRRGGGAHADVPLLPVTPGPPPPTSAAGGRERRRAGRSLLQAAAALLAVLFVGAPVAVAAEAARPGDRLWPVREATEWARLAIETDPVGDALLHLEFASRRMAALTGLLAGGADPARIAVATAELEEQLAAAARSLELADAAAGEGAEQARNALARQVTVFGEVVAGSCGDADRVPPETCARMLEAWEGSARAEARALPPGAATRAPHPSSRGADAPPGHQDPPVTTPGRSGPAPRTERPADPASDGARPQPRDDVPVDPGRPTDKGADGRDRPVPPVDPGQRGRDEVEEEAPPTPAPTAPGRGRGAPGGPNAGARATPSEGSSAPVAEPGQGGAGADNPADGRQTTPPPAGRRRGAPAKFSFPGSDVIGPVPTA